MSSANLRKVILVVVALLFVGTLLIRLNRVSLPEGPVPIVWDGEGCGHCKMHVLRGMDDLSAFDGSLFELCAQLQRRGARGVLISGVERDRKRIATSLRVAKAIPKKLAIKTFCKCCRR